MITSLQQQYNPNRPKEPLVKEKATKNENKKETEMTPRSTWQPTRVETADFYLRAYNYRERRASFVRPLLPAYLKL